MRTRLVEPRDAEATRAIYNLEVLESTVTFDLVPRTLDDQVTWQNPGEEGTYRRVPDVIDCWYDAGLAGRVLPWLRRARERGIDVLVGDPGRLERGDVVVGDDPAGGHEHA